MKPVAITATLILAVVTLTACDGQREDGTSITLNANGGNVAGAIDGKSGALKIDVPGFKGEINLPKIKLNADNFDLNGVHLYPGSTIDTVDIAGDDKGSAKHGAGLNLAFTSPADADAVRQWFSDRLGKAGYTLRDDGSALVGTSKDGEAFRLDVTPAGAGQAKGRIAMGAKGA